MRVAIHGRPNFNDRARVEKVLTAVHDHKPITHVIIEDVPGFSRLIKNWADQHHVSFTAVESKLPWLSASRLGYRRNNMMIEHKPDLALIFPGGEQTKHFIELAKTSKIKIAYVDTIMP